MYLKIGKTKIKDIQFAITAEEQKNGLMFSEFPPTITVFPYKSAEIRKFWMKNVPFSLDIIFCKNGKVLYIGKGKPYIEDEHIGPNEPCDLVIEAPAGFCIYNQIKIGDNVKVKYEPKILKKILST